MNRQMRRASKANGRRMMKGGWSDWEDMTQEAREKAAAYGTSPAGLLRFIRFMKNNIYTVQFFANPSGVGDMLHLMVRRNDEGPVRSWYELQKIKNELVGSERTAVEVFPPESELVDQANIYHLWVFPEGYKLPFGLKA